jgi:glycosyltransferase involved in cell wall biosynthesis
LRVGVLANTTWYLFNFRLNLMRALMAAGYEVVALGPADGYESRLTQAGVRHASWSVSRSGINPLAEWASVMALHQRLRAERVEVLLTYTPKGNIYGALAAWPLALRVIANVSGLGHAFTRDGPLAWLVRGLYRMTFRRAAWVFFQNREDMASFAEWGLVPGGRSELLPGSGVDVERFQPADAGGPAEAPGRPFVFLMAARLLWEKGVGEYVGAARHIKGQHAQARFLLQGFLEPRRRGSVPRAILDDWGREGLVEYIEATDDMVSSLRHADCVVLPSYREGMPRILLEAASMAKPVIAADSPGCRDALEDGVTGLLCKPKDERGLAQAMLRLMAMPAAARREMGWRGRERVLARFDERQVLGRYLAVIRAAATGPGRVHRASADPEARHSP